MTEAASVIALTPTASLRVHPAAEAVPRMPADQWRGFLADIADHGWHAAAVVGTAASPSSRAAARRLAPSRTRPSAAS